MSEQRKGFVLYRSVRDAVRCLPPEDQLTTYDAIMDYALDGTYPDLNGPPMAIFLLIKPQIDANETKYENGKKGGEFGVLGGRPKKTNPTETPKKPQVNPIETPKEKDKEKEKDKDKEKEKAKAEGAGSVNRQPGHAPEAPSCETVAEASAKNPIPYSKIVDEFHRICVSYRKVQQLSESRKKAMKAKFSSGYTMKDFVKLFELAEASDFLKGANARNFTADFDWLIKDANMAKTLEGKYANRDAITTASSGNGGYSSAEIASLEKLCHNALPNLRNP